MMVHILVRSGPEWNDVLGVFSDNLKAKAQSLADAKNKGTDASKDIFEQLSTYQVLSFELIEE